MPKKKGASAKNRQALLREALSKPETQRFLAQHAAAEEKGKKNTATAKKVGFHGDLQHHFESNPLYAEDLNASSMLKPIGSAVDSVTGDIISEYPTVIAHPGGTAGIPFPHVIPMAGAIRNERTRFRGADPYQSRRRRPEVMARAQDALSRVGTDEESGRRRTRSHHAAAAAEPAHDLVAHPEHASYRAYLGSDDHMHDVNQYMQGRYPGDPIENEQPPVTDAFWQFWGLNPGMPDVDFPDDVSPLVDFD